MARSGLNLTMLMVLGLTSLLAACAGRYQGVKIGKSASQLTNLQKQTSEEQAKRESILEGLFPETYKLFKTRNPALREAFDKAEATLQSTAAQPEAKHELTLAITFKDSSTHTIKINLTKDVIEQSFVGEGVEQLPPQATPQTTPVLRAQAVMRTHIYVVLSRDPGSTDPKTPSELLEVQGLYFERIKEEDNGIVKFKLDYVAAGTEKPEDAIAGGKKMVEEGRTKAEQQQAAAGGAAAAEVPAPAAQLGTETPAAGAGAAAQPAAQITAVTSGPRKPAPQVQPQVGKLPSGLAATVTQSIKWPPVTPVTAQPAAPVQQGAQPAPEAAAQQVPPVQPANDPAAQKAAGQFAQSIGVGAQAAQPGTPADSGATAAQTGTEGNSTVLTEPAPATYFQLGKRWVKSKLNNFLYGVPSSTAAE